MWNMVQSADRQAKLTLIGAILIKFATGIALIWGTCNVYFYSHLKHNGFQVSIKTNSIILICALVPTGLAVLFSNPFSRLVGYRAAIRICAFAFLLSPMVINLHFSIATFAIFWLVVPLTAFCLGAIPVLNCLWTQFKKDLSKISGVAIMSLSIGMIFWNILFLYIVNPDNIGAETTQSGIPIFPESVSKNTIKASNIVYFMAGLLNITGSFMVSKKQSSNLEQPLRKKDGHQEIIALEKNTLLQVERAVSDIENRLSQNSQRTKTLIDGLKSKKFLLVFCISGVMPIYLVYMVLNVKLIYMPIINDDHFLSYCSALVTISAVVGAPLWGYMADSRGFKFTLLVLVCFDTLVKLLGVFCVEKWNLALLFFLLGVNDKGMLTIIGPGLIGMFGIQMATQLVPYKGLAAFLGYIIAPTFQMFLGNILSLQSLLLIFVGFSIIGIFLAFYLNFKVHYKQIIPAQEQEMKTIVVKN